MVGIHRKVIYVNLFFYIRPIMFLIETQLVHTRGAVGVGAEVRSGAALPDIPEYILVLYREKRALHYTLYYTLLSRALYLICTV